MNSRYAWCPVACVLAASFCTVGAACAQQQSYAGPPGGYASQSVGATPQVPPAAEPIRQPQGLPLTPASDPNQAGAVQPNWIPLAPEHQRYLDQILAYWEQRSSVIKRYRCKFERFEYDPVFGPRHTYNKYSKGEIKYSQPDKGLFRVDESLIYKREADGRETYASLPVTQYECWICDGKSVFEHDFQNQRLIERLLPPDMQGQAIAEGPLPFLFGARADEIRSRYWLRVITPREAKQQYWLEAIPKRQQDAANFKMVHIVIDEQEFLPDGMVIFDRNFTEERPARTTFHFTQREVNWNVIGEKLNLFHREFYEPATPSGWKKVTMNYESAPDAPRTAMPSAIDQPAAR